MHGRAHDCVSLHLSDSNCVSILDFGGLVSLCVESPIHVHGPYKALAIHGGDQRDTRAHAPRPTHFASARDFPNSSFPLTLALIGRVAGGCVK